MVFTVVSNREVPKVERIVHGIDAGQHKCHDSKCCDGKSCKNCNIVNDDPFHDISLSLIKSRDFVSGRLDLFGEKVCRLDYCQHFCVSDVHQSLLSLIKSSEKDYITTFGLLKQILSVF